MIYEVEHAFGSRCSLSRTIVRYNAPGGEHTFVRLPDYQTFLTKILNPQPYTLPLYAPLYVPSIRNPMRSPIRTLYVLFTVPSVRSPLRPLCRTPLRLYPRLSLPYINGSLHENRTILVTPYVTSAFSP